METNDRFDVEFPNRGPDPQDNCAVGVNVENRNSLISKSGKKSCSASQNMDEILNMSVIVDSTNVDVKINMKDSISALKFVPGTNDTHLMMSSWDGCVYIVDISSNWPKCQTEQKAPILGCTATDINSIFFGGLDNKLYFTNFLPGGSIGQDKDIGAHNDAIRCVDYSDEKDLVVSGSWDCSVKLWDRRTHKNIRKMEQMEQVFCMKVRDEILVVGTGERRVLAWDLRNCSSPLINRSTAMSNYQNRCIDIFSDKNRYVIGSLDGRISVEAITRTTSTDQYAFKAHVSKDVAHPVNSIRLQWLAYLEFSHSREEVHELSWDSIPLRIPITQKLWEMMTTSNGIPHSLRPQMWLRLSGALEKRANASNQPYWKIVRESTANEYFSYAKHIEKDLTRILPGNGCFTKSDSPGIPRLRRLLRSIAWLYPEIGYCQGFGTVVAHLLLFMEEEDVFWLMMTIIEDILPGSYFSSDFVGIRTDSLVLSRYVAQYFPNVDQLLKEHDIELGLIVFTWFLTLFASVVHVKILLRIWDLFFAEGDLLLFKVMLALIKLKVDDLLQLKNSAEIFNFLSDLPSVVEDFDILDINQFESLNRNNLEQERRKQSSALASDGSIFTNNSRRVKKRDFRKPEKSGRGNMLKTIFGEYRGPEDMKNKNVRQTELMVDLHEAILQIGRHFIASDQKFTKISLEPDFSLESHAKDHEKYTQGFSSGTKRAKALADFERRDDDELGFRKNDILTIMSSKDEHCWIGELNGLRGWFPAKCVVILDERSKQYSAAGDDSVTEGIADLVRGTLCPALKRIFEQGMKKPTSLVGPIHPWMFIEEVAMKEIERDYKSVYSRLVLCKTYRLDEDGKVLSPEELLYRCVELVNRSHEKVQMDIKMRSLICLGLNEQVLHLWVEILCSSAEVVNKWYHPWSFLNSPGWVGLKCELRILSQFSFTLNPDWELRSTKEDKFEVKNGVRDMLVKHHLFSWNL